MKNFTQWKVLVLASLLLFANSCKKEKQTRVFNISENPVALQNKDNFAHFTYNPDGSLLRMGMYENNGRAVSIYNFQYDAARLAAVVKGNTTWKYIYEGARLLRIEIENRPGKNVATYELTYTDEGRLAEQVNYFPSASGKPVATTRSTYHYNQAGNLTKTSYYNQAGGAWVKTGETRIAAYDRNKNTMSHLEIYPFIPGQFSTNNPLKEEYLNEFDEVIETLLYEYAYDTNGRVVSRKTTRISAWFPETVTYTNIHY